MFSPVYFLGRLFVKLLKSQGSSDDSSYLSSPTFNLQPFKDHSYPPSTLRQVGVRETNFSRAANPALPEGGITKVKAV